MSATFRIATIALFIALTMPNALGVLERERIESEDIINAAKTLYGGQHYVVHSAQEPNFAAAFPNYGLYVVLNTTTIPPQAATMAIRNGTTTAYDVTKDWKNLVSDAGYTLLDAQKTMLLGRAFAAVGHAALGIDRVLVSATDSTWLNHTVTNPSVTNGIATWTFKAWTWSPTNGRLSQWTIHTTPTSVTDAKMHVKEIAIGPYGATLEAAILLPDDAITTVFSPFGQTGLRNASSPTPTTLDLTTPSADDSCTVTTTTTNFDGSEWTVCYVGSSTPPPSIATVGQALADGGTAAYQKMIRTNPHCGAIENPQPNMDFTAPPNDCTIQIGMLRTIQVHGVSVAIPACASTPPACTDFGRIYIHPYFRELLLLLGAYTDPMITAADLAESIVGHEYLHLIQEDIRGAYSQEFDESQARFIETILDPDVTHRADSLFFHHTQGVSDGPQSLQTMPTTDYCERKFPASLLIGHAYALTGNNPLFHRQLIVNSSLACKIGSIANAISSALNDSDSPMTFDALFDDVAVRMYTRDFTWTSSDGTQRDWGLYLLPVTSTTLSPGETPSKELSRAREYLILPASAAGMVTCDGPARGLILRPLGGSISTETCDAIPRPLLANGETAVGVIAIVHDLGDDNRKSLTVLWEVS